MSITPEMPPVLNLFLSGNARLPVCPVVFTRLSAALGSSDTSQNELASILKADVALTAAVLHVSNSAFYGALRQISTVDQAILRIGYAEVWKIAVGLKAKEIFCATGGAVFHNWLYHHSLYTGLFLRQLGRAVNPQWDEFFFTAGILHDLGRLVLAQVDANYPKACMEVGAFTSHGSQWERQQYQADHAQISAALIEFWNLPKLLSSMIEAHHSPSASDRIKVCLWAADVWSYVVSNPGTLDPKVGGNLLETKVFPAVKINKEEAAKIAKRVEDEKLSLTHE